MFVIFVYARCQKYLLFAFWSGQGPKVTQSAFFRLYENAFSSTSKCLLFRTQKKIASYGRESSLLAASKLFLPDENALFEREKAFLSRKLE